jgi:hypothetical protein
MGAIEYTFCRIVIVPVHLPPSPPLGTPSLYNCRRYHTVFSQISVGTLALLLHITDISLQLRREISAITMCRY